MISPKPLPPNPPKPKRLERPKHVTIAAGFVCMDGIVLCADTQETITNLTKNTTEKMSLWYDTNFTLAVTGSGDAEIVETLAQRIIEAGRSEYTLGNYLYGDRAKKLVEGALLRFWKQHLLPYPQYERPQIDLLIAIQCHHNRYLLRASGNTLRDLDPGISSGASCVGIGATLGLSLIEKLYSPFSKLDDLIVVACYVIFQAKKWVDGCGGNTDLLVLTDELRTGMRDDEIKALEEFFGDYDEQCAGVLTSITNPNASDIEATTAIHNMQRDLIDHRQKLAKGAPRLLEFFEQIRMKEKKVTS